MVDVSCVNKIHSSFDGTLELLIDGFLAHLTEAIGQVGQESVNEQLKCAVESGVNFIDTANVYHEGWS